jgi:hypothetical protein
MSVGLVRHRRIRDFAGMSPASYLVAERPLANHIRID